MTFIDHGLPLIAVVALWFASTGVVLWLDSRPRATFRRSLLWSGAAAGAAALVLALTVDDPRPGAAYAAFVAALVIWGWHELSFLTGIVTGPNRLPCPPHLTGWARFRAAAATLIHHEIALALTAALLVALAWGRANPTGAMTFLALLALRLSAKLNVFFGVPAFMPDMLPPHLAYLRSYFARGRMNRLFPVSMAAMAGAGAWLAMNALATERGPAVSASLLFALVALGAIEHLFLVIPFRDAALWNWAKHDKNKVGRA